MKPKEKSEWIGLRVLFRHTERETTILGWRKSYESEVKCGVIKDVSESGYVLVKEREYTDGEWYPVAEFRLIQVLPDDPEDEKYKDSYHRLPY